MNIIIFILIFLLTTGSSLNKSRIISNQDGTIKIRYYDDKFRKENESDKQMMDRIDILDGITEQLIEVNNENIPSLDRNQRHKFRVINDKVEIDTNAPDTQEAIKRNNRNQAKAKLRSGQTLDQTDIESLFPN